MVRKRRYKQGELFGNLGYFLTMSGIFDKCGGKGTASELKPTATSTYFCLRSMAQHEDGTASVSSEEIGERIGATKPTVDRALALLEEQELIERLNPNSGTKRRVYQIKERLPYYEAEDEDNSKHSGWIVAQHKPKETTARLKEAKEFFYTKMLPSSAVAAGVHIERVEVNVENLQVNVSITHNHYGDSTQSEYESTTMAVEAVQDLIAAIKKGGAIGAWAERALLEHKPKKN